MTLGAVAFTLGYYVGWVSGLLLGLTASAAIILLLRLLRKSPGLPD